MVNKGGGTRREGPKGQGNAGVEDEEVGGVDELPQSSVSDSWFLASSSSSFSSTLTTSTLFSHSLS